MARFAELVKASADPAANNEIVFVADEDMTVRSLAFQVVLDANVANRFIALVADDGNPANIFYRCQDGTARTAGTTNDYSFFEAAAGTGISSGFPLPDGGLRLRKGDRLRTVTTGMQAGDNYGVAWMQVERP